MSPNSPSAPDSMLVLGAAFDRFPSLLGTDPVARTARRGPGFVGPTPTCTRRGAAPDLPRAAPSDTGTIPSTPRMSSSSSWLRTPPIPAGISSSNSTPSRRSSMRRWRTPPPTAPGVPRSIRRGIAPDWSARPASSMGDGRWKSRFRSPASVSPRPLLERAGAGTATASNTDRPTPIWLGLPPAPNDRISTCPDRFGIFEFNR